MIFTLDSIAAIDLLIRRLGNTHVTHWGIVPEVWSNWGFRVLIHDFKSIIHIWFLESSCMIPEVHLEHQRYNIMHLWGYVYCMEFCRLSVGVPLVLYQRPLNMSFGRYVEGFCLLFRPGMYVGAVYLVFGWYSIVSFIGFTDLLSFGYRHMDFLTLPV